MENNRFVRPIELHKLTGVATTNISRMLKKGRLAPARTEDGLVDTHHHVVADWLATNGYKVSDLFGGPIEGEDEWRDGLPPELKKSPENITLKQIVEKFGSIVGYKSYIEALRLIADYQNKALTHSIKSGEMIPRDLVAKSIFGLINGTYQRLLSDVPEKLSRTIVALADSTDEEAELVVKVKEEIKKEISRSLREIKESVLKKKLKNVGSRSMDRGTD